MIGLILTLAIVGFLLWLITTKIPMDPTVAVVIQVVIVICALLYVLRLFGVGDMPIPKLH